MVGRRDQPRPYPNPNPNLRARTLWSTDLPSTATVFGPAVAASSRTRFFCPFPCFDPLFDPVETTGARGLRVCHSLAPPLPLDPLGLPAPLPTTAAGTVALVVTAAAAVA